MTTSSSSAGFSGMPNDYDPRKVLQAGMEEHATFQISYEEMTRRVLDAAAPMAAHQLVDLCMHAPNPNTRLKAAQYIVDRKLGMIREQSLSSEGKAPLEELLGATVVQEAEYLTRNGL